MPKTGSKTAAHIVMDPFESNEAHIAQYIRCDLDSPGGLAFFEWTLREHGKCITPRIWCAVSKLLGADNLSPPASGPNIRPAHGTWAENDWEALKDSFRRAGLHIRNPLTFDEIREAVGEWLVYRAQRGGLPPGFDALEDYYLEHLE